MNRTLVCAFSALVLGGLAPSTSHARTEALYQPDALLVPCALDPAAIRAAVRAGLRERDWVVKDEGAAGMEARRTKDEHVAVVGITLEARRVILQYRTSTKLDYRVERGQPQIDSDYNKWVRNIEKDIAISLSKACR